MTAPNWIMVPPAPAPSRAPASPARTSAAERIAHAARALEGIPVSRAEGLPAAVESLRASAASWLDRLARADEMKRAGPRRFTVARLITSRGAVRFVVIDARNGNQSGFLRHRSIIMAQRDADEQNAGRWVGG